MAISQVWDVLVVLYLRCDRKVGGVRYCLPSFRVQPVFNHSLLINTRKGLKPNLCISKVDIVAVVGDVVTRLIIQTGPAVEALKQLNKHLILKKLWRTCSK